MNRERRAGPATVVSRAMIAAWVAWWVVSVGRGALIFGRLTWVPMLPIMPGDFTVHIDHVARVWASGVDPYARPCDWVCALFPYPPMVPRLFAWVSLVSTPTAVRVWLAAVSVCLAVGSWAACRSRGALRLAPIPPAVALAAVLFCTPAVVAMERGQCDPLVIPALAAASGLLGRRAAGHDLAAGGLLGLTAWLKYYPGLTLVGLIALRRWRAATAFVVVAGLIGVVDRAEVRRSVENGVTVSRSRTKAEALFCHPTTHSLVEDWRAIRAVRRVRWLRTIPGPAAAALLLVPAAALVSLRVARAGGGDGPLVFPYFLWLTAAATFALPYSIDYNL
ncbi:MAG: DUF2029 domain-containing protein, partial [Planctomycetia bacterium]|nr:DUF2029 domain-containing protein [Planctomycetia bacterium]